MNRCIADPQSPKASGFYASFTTGGIRQDRNLTMFSHRLAPKPAIAQSQSLISAAAKLAFSHAMDVRSRPCGTARLPAQAERGLPGLLHRDLLSPRAHER